MLKSIPSRTVTAEPNENKNDLAGRLNEGSKMNIWNFIG